MRDLLAMGSPCEIEECVPLLDDVLKDRREVEHGQRRRRYLTMASVVASGKFRWREIPMAWFDSLYFATSLISLSLNSHSWSEAHFRCP